MYSISEIVDAEGCFRRMFSESGAHGESTAIFRFSYHCGVRSEIRFAVRRVKAFEWQSLTAIRVEPWSYASSLFYGMELFVFY